MRGLLLDCVIFLIDDLHHEDYGDFFWECLEIIEILFGATSLSSEQNLNKNHSRKIPATIWKLLHGAFFGGVF
jgi:hypothetical protein